MILNFKDKNVLVCGMARSGQSAVKLLAEKGAKVCAQDLKAEINFSFDPEALGVTLHLGKGPEQIIDKFDLVIISPGIPFDLPYLNHARALNIPVWGELELAYRFCPCPIIGITGTNGKTTVTTLVGNIMKAFNPKTEVLGNIGSPFTDYVNSLDENSLAVAEVSSFQLETIQEFAPFISAVLNLTPDHLDRHKTMEIYKYTKERIFENQGAEDFCILNYDNLYCRNMNPPGKKIYFSISERLKEGVFLENGVIKASLFDKEITIADVKFIKTLPENALAAAAICLCGGAPPELVAEGLREFKGVPHRLEYIKTIKGIEFVNDSKATNIDAAVKGIEGIKSPIVLIGGGYDKGADFEPWVSCFDKKVRHFIIIGAVTEQLISTCEKIGYKDISCAETLEQAVNMAYKSAKHGDTVLLSPACASFDMFKDFEHRGDLFREYVLALDNNS